MNIKNLVGLNKQNIANLLYKFLITIKPLDKSKVFYIYDIDNTIAKTANFKNNKKVYEKSIINRLYFKIIELCFFIKNRLIV